jgi:hypothetical protein
MAYTVEIENRAVKQITALQSPIRDRALDVLDSLKEEPGRVAASSSKADWSPPGVPESATTESSIGLTMTTDWFVYMASSAVTRFTETEPEYYA